LGPPFQTKSTHLINKEKERGGGLKGRQKQGRSKCGQSPVKKTKLRFKKIFSENKSRVRESKKVAARMLLQRDEKRLLRPVYKKATRNARRK